MKIFSRGWRGRKGTWRDRKGTWLLENKRQKNIKRAKTEYSPQIKFLFSSYSFAATPLIFQTTVKPLVTNTSKEFIKCRILHFLIMECCRYLVFFIK